MCTHQGIHTYIHALQIQSIYLRISLLRSGIRTGATATNLINSGSLAFLEKYAGYVLMSSLDGSLSQTLGGLPSPFTYSNACLRESYLVTWISVTYEHTYIHSHTYMLACIIYCMQIHLSTHTFRYTYILYIP